MVEYPTINIPTFLNTLWVAFGRLLDGVTDWKLCIWTGSRCPWNVVPGAVSSVCFSLWSEVITRSTNYRVCVCVKIVYVFRGRNKGISKYSHWCIRYFRILFDTTKQTPVFLGNPRALSDWNQHLVVASWRYSLLSILIILCRVSLKEVYNKDFTLWWCIFRTVLIICLGYAWVNG